MIRIIVKGTYMNPGGKSEGDFKTFDVEFRELEKYLSEAVGYAGCGSREVIGAEILKVQAEETSITLTPYS